VKSFWQLLHEPGFALMMAFALLMIGWDLAYGTKVLGFALALILAVVIAVNVWRTR